MKRLQFPYIKYLVAPETVKPAQYIYRPVIPVKLAVNQKTIVFDDLIDSGADECTFPGWVMKILGRDVHAGRQRIFKGIGGSVLAYLHPTIISIGEEKFLVNIYYSHEWDDLPFGLLGQGGFFSRFDVHFRYKEKIVELMA